MADPTATAGSAGQDRVTDSAADRPCSSCGRPRAECRTPTDLFLSCCHTCAANDGDTHRERRSAASEPMWVGDQPLTCEGCGKQIDPGAEGRAVVAGGEDRDLYYHQGCVQP